VSAPDHAAHGEAGPRAKTVPAIALVTGGARRIGATICRALCASGYAVAIHCNASLDQAETLACELRQSGGRAVALAADLADADATAALIDRATAALGPVSVLVNNAATFRYDTAGSFTVADFEYHVRPNLRAPVMLVRDFARALGTRPGAVINMLDHKVTALNPDFFTYTLAKVALAGATHTMAASFGGRIRVNGIAPGITLLSGKQTEAGFARAWGAPPLGRSATPAEIAEAVLLILSVPSLNGQVVVLDGGESLLARARDVAFDPALSPDL
jgi:NAD(P)-dependent dehydrogenase (short-subunit alcohol dehydrogenase family)